MSHRHLAMEEGVCHLINGRPRKCLKCRSSEQVVKEYLKRCT